MPRAFHLLPYFASWWHCQGLPFRVSWSLHSPYIRSSVKVWVWYVDPDNWKFSLEIQQPPQELHLPSALFCLVHLPKMQVLDFPCSLCRTVSWGNGYEWCNLFRNTQLELAFVSAHLIAQDFRISDQCKQFLDFWMFVESFLLCISTSDIYIFVFFFLNTLRNIY